MSKHNQEDIYDIVLSHFNNASIEVVEEIRKEIKALVLDLIDESNQKDGQFFGLIVTSELRKKVNDL